MTVAELQDKLKDMPPDAVVSLGANGNDAIIALAFIGLGAWVMWLIFRD